MTKLTFLFLLGLLGCADEKVENTTTQQDHFENDTSVRIAFPENGAVVEDSFYLQYASGASIAHLELWMDGTFNEALNKTETETLIHLEEGPHTISLKALDNDATLLNEHSITVTVPTEYWVTITAPADGSTVMNPVQFSVSSSDNIDSVEIFSDDWSLGTIASGQVLNYDFSGTGFPRDIQAVGYSDGVQQTEHNITVTIDAGTEPLSSDFNEYVNEILSTYPTDGSYGYYWPSSGGWLGTTEDIVYQGTLVAEGDPDDRSYCVGLTFEVFMKAWIEIDNEFSGDGTINGMSVNDLYEFRLDWYVRDLFGAGPADGVDYYGIGELVTDWDDVQEGDFLQFWRNSGSGHNVIFTGWEWDMDGNIVGFQYWSTQNSTDGIGYNSEFFGSSGSTVNPQYFFPARVYTPDNWIQWQ
jgi:hypothetical protein